MDDLQIVRIRGGVRGTIEIGVIVMRVSVAVIPSVEWGRVVYGFFPNIARNPNEI